MSNKDLLNSGIYWVATTCLSHEGARKVSSHLPAWLQPQRQSLSRRSVHWAVVLSDCPQVQGSEISFRVGPELFPVRLFGEATEEFWKI